MGVPFSTQTSAASRASAAQTSATQAPVVAPDTGVRPTASTGWHLQPAGSRRFTAEETYTVTYPNFHISNFQVMLPIPPNIPGRQEDMTAQLEIDNF